LSAEDVRLLHGVWNNYRDDLTWPWYEAKPQFSDEDFDIFYKIAQKVVDAMILEYGQRMVLDQATISNTSHVGHPPHADNVQFDSVWWKGKRIRAQDQIVASQEGAYVLWRSEKTSYRSYSCSMSLADPKGYEGGEVQFFEKWGDKDPIESHKCEVGHGIAFCGCQRNIHAVTGVRSGFRLVLLVWTRPPEAHVPESQMHVCYFRPGTGFGCWLTTADLMKYRASKRFKTGRIDPGVPIPPENPDEEDDETCKCKTCVDERNKLAWKDIDPTKEQAAPTTPTTSAGNSPRPEDQAATDSPDGADDADMVAPSGDVEMTAADEDAVPATAATGSKTGVTQATSDRWRLAKVVSSFGKEEAEARGLKHCPHPQGMVRCKGHERVELPKVLSKVDMKKLLRVWEKYQDDLSNPWYAEKPDFDDWDFQTYRQIAEKVVRAMSAAYGEPLVLDQATISSTNHLGHPPHADNVQFDSVWWHGRQIKQKDELEAARGGAGVLWKESKTSYRNYSASVSLTDPSEYGGGDLEFYDSWGQRDPVAKRRYPAGSGVGFCGCPKNIHAVTGVRWGFRLNLLIWTRPQGVEVPEDQRHVCYFRPGTGLSVWLTTAELMRKSGENDYPSMRPGERPWRSAEEDALADKGGNRHHGPEEEDDGEEETAVCAKASSTWDDGWRWRPRWGWNVWQH
jgi:predicted 2-oxoglutarate/Fe(II)-dependent dioxygenase YbiX